MSPIRTAPAGLTAADAALRARYLREVLGVLYPGQADAAPSPGAPVTEYLVLPGARRPRLLVPTGSRRVAAAAVLRYAEPQSRLARLKRTAVAAALRTGAATVLLRDRVRIVSPAEDTIDAYLGRTLGIPLAISVHIGPARANRKPVLQLLTPTGDTVGFAKLGTGPLTRRLVRAETTALTALSHARPRRLTIPAVLHCGQWQGHQVLVQSALPIWRPRAPLPPGRLTEAMVEVSRCCGVCEGPLAASPYWAELSGRLAELDQDQDQDQGGCAAAPEVAGLRAAADSLLASGGELTLRYGAWHGDWAPWNMAALADTLLVWDWERFTVGVPLGFDAVHHDLQRRIQAGTDPAGAVEATLRQAATLLAPFAVTGPAVQVTALLYLLDLATRYLADRQAGAGARLGVLGTWLLPVLVKHLAVS